MDEGKRRFREKKKQETLMRVAEGGRRNSTEGKVDINAVNNCLKSPLLDKKENMEKKSSTIMNDVYSE